MHIEKLKYLIDLYECGNYTETARKNFISQTAVTQYIHALEREFQVRLFDRTVMPVRPTAAGELFYHEARILWEQYQNMYRKMENFQQSHTQTLRIAYASMAEIEQLLPVIERFNQNNPNTELTLSKVLIRELGEGLERNRYDLAVCIDSAFPADQELNIVPLYEGEYAALVGKNHPLFHCDVIETQELYRHPLIMLSPDTIGDSFRVMEERSRETGFVPNIVKTVPDLETEMVLIFTDSLIGFAPDNYDVGSFAGHVRLIPVRNFNHPFKIVLASRKKNDSPLVRDFMNTVAVR